MASGLITLGQIEGGKVEAVTDFLFLGSKITVDGDCNNQSRIWLLLRRKAMIKLDSVLKSKNIILTTKVHIIEGMVFPVVMYGCESWAIRKAEHWRIDAFELWCWKRLLRVPWTARRTTVNPKGNQPWILIGRTAAKAEAPVLWPPEAKSQLTGKDLDAGKDWKWEEKGKTED